MGRSRESEVSEGSSHHLSSLEIDIEASHTWVQTPSLSFIEWLCDMERSTGLYASLRGSIQREATLCSINAFLAVPGSK